MSEGGKDGETLICGEKNRKKESEVMELKVVESNYLV